MEVLLQFIPIGSFSIDLGYLRVKLLQEDEQKLGGTYLKRKQKPIRIIPN